MHRPTRQETNPQNLESKLFEFSEIDFASEDGIQYLDCTLEMPLGHHRVGSHFEAVHLDYSQSTLSLYRNNVEIERYEIRLIVGKQIEVTNNA